MSCNGQMDPATIHTAIHQARDSARQIGVLQIANDRTIRTLEAALKQGVEAPFDDASPAPPKATEHCRLHRSGVPSRIDSNPELQAFIRARIGHQTFAQIINEAAAAFPPNRRTSMSARQISADPT
jgi:hypothetical protein